MFNVYWMEFGKARHRLFETEKMAESMTFMEALRKRQHAGDDVSFITLSSENPNSVGKQGVDVTGPDYDWKKRRL